MNQSVGLCKSREDSLDESALCDFVCPNLPLVGTVDKSVQYGDIPDANWRVEVCKNAESKGQSSIMCHNFASLLPVLVVKNCLDSLESVVEGSLLTMQ